MADLLLKRLFEAVCIWNNPCLEPDTALRLVLSWMAVEPYSESHNRQIREGRRSREYGFVTLNLACVLVYAVPNSELHFFQRVTRQRILEKGYVRGALLCSSRLLLRSTTLCYSMFHHTESCVGKARPVLELALPHQNALRRRS
jgi:hypothetical protein